MQYERVLDDDQGETPCGTRMKTTAWTEVYKKGAGSGFPRMEIGRSIGRW